MMWYNGCAVDLRWSAKSDKKMKGENKVFFGTDSLNGQKFSLDGGPRNYQPGFYLGRIGGELITDYTFFDFGVGLSPNLSFGYWDLAGNLPGSEQANAFEGTINSLHSVNKHMGFFDVEPGNGGWGSNVITNRGVLEEALAYFDQRGIRPGVYISELNWNNFFGKDWKPKTPFSLWLAGTSCPMTLSEIETDFGNLPIVGGQHPLLWQFRISGCPGAPNQDLNVSAINPLTWTGVPGVSLNGPENTLPGKKSAPLVTSGVKNSQVTMGAATVEGWKTELQNIVTQMGKIL